MVLISKSNENCNTKFINSNQCIMLTTMFALTLLFLGYENMSHNDEYIIRYNHGGNW